MSKGGDNLLSSENIIKATKMIEKYRKKIIAMLLFPVVVALGVYGFTDYIVEILIKPLNGMTLFFLTPMEGLMAKIEISVIGAVIITIPVLAYILVSLLAPKINKSMRMIIRFVIIPFATIAFIGGCFFGYKLVIPTTINFLLSCGNDFMSANIRGSDYFSFIMLLIISIGLIFELPIVLAALAKAGIISSRILINKRKVAILSIVIFVAVITPTPDIFTLCMVSMPMIILFEISIWWIYLMEKSAMKALKGGFQ